MGGSSDDDEIGGEMSEDRDETADGSEGGAQLKRKPDRATYGKSHKVFRFNSGRGSGRRGRERSPRLNARDAGGGDGTVTADDGGTASVGPMASRQ